MNTLWQPHVTVATIVEHDNKFLMVRETTDSGIRINQPAGHWEAGETLAEAALRETLEETGWVVELTGFVSISTYLAPSNQITYLRTTFAARPGHHIKDRCLDDGIIEAFWLSRAELDRLQTAWRSPLVGEVIDQYLKFGVQPLELATLHR